MSLPKHIPTGVRVVVRVRAGRDPFDGRMKFSDYLGHVLDWDGRRLRLDQDPSRDGRRPSREVALPADSIVIIKPVPERRAFPRPSEPGTGWQATGDSRRPSQGD